MHRRLPGFVGSVVLALTLGACFGERDGGDVGQSAYTARARFVPGGEVTVVQVTVNDRQALRGADLLGPGGAVISADTIDAKQVLAESQPSSIRPSIGIGADSGVGLMLPFGGAVAAPGTQTFGSGLIRSTASIRLPDPDGYLKDWRLWQIRLRLGDAPNIRFLSLPAPAPPSSL